MSKGLHGEKEGKEEMGEKKAWKIDLTNLYVVLVLAGFMGKCDTGHQDRVSVVSDRFKRYHVNFIICRCKISAGRLFGDFI